MKILKISGIIIICLVVLVVILGLLAPKEYLVERSTVIEAPKELVFDYVKYWRNWRHWSPWAEQDPSMQVSIEGADGETGSVYKWTGDPKLTGKGEMVNTGVKDFAEIAYHLEFIEPWADEADGYLRISGIEGGTKATWGLYGDYPPIPWNIMSLFLNMEKMMRKDLERGLELLKQYSEQKYQAAAVYEVKEVKFPKVTYAALKAEVPMSGIHDFFASAFGKIQGAMAQKRANMTGAPVGLYYTWDEANMKTEMAAGIPVDKVVKTGEVVNISLDSHKAYSVDYYGPYDKVEDAYSALSLYFTLKNLKMMMPVIEQYITDPSAEPDSTKWLTKIYFFVE